MESLHKEAPKNTGIRGGVLLTSRVFLKFKVSNKCLKPLETSHQQNIIVRS